VVSVDISHLLSTCNVLRKPRGKWCFDITAEALSISIYLHRIKNPRQNAASVA
jgi:hypothetical protein